MRKFWTIFAYEIVTIVWRPSFWLGAIGLPLLALGLYGAINLLNSQLPDEQGGFSLDMFQSAGSMQSLEDLTELVNPSEDVSLPLGFVDLAGVTTRVPPEFDADAYRRFSSQAEAQQAFDQGQVRAFYLFPLDFIRTGQVLYTAENLSISRAVLLDDGLDYWMKYNLLDGAEDKIAAASEPLGLLLETNLDPANAPRFNVQDMKSMFLMQGVVYFLLILLFASSGMIFASFNREANNRVMEVLLVSTSSEQILWSKLCALSLIGFAQTGLWLGAAALFGKQMGSSFSIEALEAISPQLFGWALLFIGLGFLLYGTLMMGLTTLFPFLREASQVIGALVLPLMAPMFLLMVFPETPGHPVMVLFSLFPLTAPTTILVRLLLSDVPLWQLLLSAAILLASAMGVIRIVARHFRPAHLLGGRSLRLLKSVR